MPRSLTSAGLVVKTLAEILTDIKARISAAPSLGPNANVEDGSIYGDLTSVFGREIVQLDELALALYSAFRRTAAEDSALDNVGDWLGVPRLDATSSTATVTATGTPATSIPENSRIRVPSGPTFITKAAAVIGGGGTVDIIVASEVTGPIEAAAGSLTEIVDATAGWTSVTNAADATPGRERELDPRYRDRITRSLQTGECSSDQAIREAIEAADPDILSVTVQSNRDLATDAEGIPGKSFRAVVFPSAIDTEAVASAIFDTMPAGIKSDGSDVELTFVDPQGKNQKIRFDFADEIDLHLEIDVFRDANLYPDNGDDLVRAAVDLYDEFLFVGTDFVPFQLSCLIAEIRGVFDVVIRVGTAPSPTQTTPFAISLTEIAQLDSADPGGGGRTTLFILDPL